MAKEWDTRTRSGWGDNVSYWGQARTEDGRQALKFVGHTTPRPEVGDLIVAKLESGAVGKFRICEVTFPPLHDPPDMWWALCDERVE